MPTAAPRPAPGLPGLALPGRLPGRLPRELLAPGTLLLAGVEPGRPVNLVGHQRQWGSVPSLGLHDLITRVAAAEVVGAGGAAFPTDRKLESLSGSRVSHVIVNGAEGETASGKDGVLLGHVPHLVLDGAVTAARALGAPRIVVRISADRPDLAISLRIALAERRDAVPIELSIGPATFVAGEATAVIRAITGGPALPADLGRPRRSAAAWRAGVPTCCSATPRRSPGWHSRRVVWPGGRPWPARPVPCATRVSSSFRRAARWPTSPLQPVGWSVPPGVLITGGWHGRWVPWDGLTAATELTRDALSELGGRWGAGAFVWIPEDLPTWDALAGVARELAEGTAGTVRAVLAGAAGRGGCHCQRHGCQEPPWRDRGPDGAGGRPWDLRPPVRGRRGAAQRTGPDRGGPMTTTSPARGTDTGSRVLSVDWERCAGHGVCAAALGERIDLDSWGYPIGVTTRGEAIPDSLVRAAKLAVATCPAAALRLERRARP